MPFHFSKWDRFAYALLLNIIVIGTNLSKCHSIELIDHEWCREARRVTCKFFKCRFRQIENYTRVSNNPGVRYSATRCRPRILAVTGNRGAISLCLESEVTGA